ncbi:LysR family transcriptional regulator [Alteromonas sediminis]|uniref:LysR family transcriptional regulator n=1 Tax=Alteromonas sediminis TaxID=2259342 RepID=A0A3N5YD17_9ALTE|nr:LysR family transcriptional regulator [Alteromonas sediminis]RPJ67315.1 LysR family transcriptional regulator [Alteromonas sediminis]
MSVSYKQIVAFIQVAKSATFAEAADHLHITQPALSVTIKKLEQALGGALFVRTTRTVELTPEGKHFFDDAKALLSHWDTAVLDIKNRFALRRGTLSVASMPAFAESYLPELLRRFNSIYQNVFLRIRDEVMEEVIDSVLAGKSELGFVFEPERKEGLIFTPLFENRFVVVMSTNHRLAQIGELDWQNVRDEAHVIMHKETSVRTWIDEALPAGLQLNIVAETSQLGTVGQLVAKSFGIAIVPELCRYQMEQKGLVCKPFNEPKLHRAVGIIHSSRKPLSMPARFLLEDSKNRLS